MKIAVLLWLVMVVLALPAHAGEVTIRETETAIIVEYTGTPDNRPVAGQQAQPATPAPKEQPALPMSRKEKREEEQRKALESRKAARDEGRPASPDAAE